MLVKEKLIYYYETNGNQVFRSETIDYRLLNDCVRCLKVEHNTVQVLKDTFSEWQDYPIPDKQLSFIILKAKDIPRSWHSLYQTWGSSVIDL